MSKCNFCRDCKFWNDIEHTYVKADDCCSFWHTGYYFFEDAGNRVNKSCFVPRKQNIQLTINFEL